MIMKSRIITTTAQPIMIPATAPELRPDEPGEGAVIAFDEVPDISVAPAFSALVFKFEVNVPEVRAEFSSFCSCSAV